MGNPHMWINITLMFVNELQGSLFNNDQQNGLFFKVVFRKVNNFMVQYKS